MFWSKFLGFIPKSQKEKLEFIVKLFNSSMPTVCYTSPNRIKKDLDFFDSQGLDSEIVICRELTKKFETIYRGKASELKHQFESDVKGEITIVIGPSSSQNEINLDLDEAIKILIKNNVSKKDISKSLESDYETIIDNSDFLSIVLGLQRDKDKKMLAYRGIAHGCVIVGVCPTSITSRYLL